jgi:acyl carrier protein
MPQREAVSDAGVIEIVHGILIDEFEVEAADLEPDALLKDLGIDSLDGVDLVVALEKAFHCRIGEQEARGIRTLQDLYDRVFARLRAAAEPRV